MTEHLLKLRPQRRFWVAVFVATVGLIVAVGYNQYRTEEKHVSQEWSQNLTAVAALKADQLAAWRKDRLADTIRFAQGPSLISAMRNFIAKPDDPDCLKAARFMLDLNRKGRSYENALMVTPAGELLLAAVAVSEPLPETTKQTIQNALTTHASTFSAIYRGSDNKILIDSAAPVCGEDGQPFAVFILRTDASAYLYPLIRFWPTDSLTAETLLVRREGDSVVFLNAVRHGYGTALTLRIPLTRSDVPAVRAVLGLRGVCNGQDYRNIDVLADVRPIPDSDWFLVTKVDRSEILKEVHYHASIIARFVGLGILFVAALTIADYRRRQSHLYRDLYRVEREQREAHEQFETILYSIGDAVIVTDAQACLRQMNPVAERLTGWKETEAIGKPLEEIFRIINEENRQPTESPVWRVLHEGKVAGLANHTVLIARDGIERPIADSGAPVRDEHGAMSGVVLVFRDQSAEYAAQKALRESEAQYSDLFRNMTEGVALHELICDSQGRPIDYRFLKVNPAFEQLTGLTADRVVGRRVLEVLPTTEPHWIETYGAVAKEGRATRFENYSAALGRYFRVTAFRPRPGQFCTLFDDITELKKNEKDRQLLENQLQQSQRVEAVGRLAGGVAHDFNNMLAVIVGNAELVREHLDVSSPLQADLTEIIKASKRSADLVKQLLAFASRQTIMPRILNLNDTIASMLNMLKRLIGEEVSLDWSPRADLWNVKLDPSQIDQILVNLTVNARDAINGVGKIGILTDNVTIPQTGREGPVETPWGDYVRICISDNGCGMEAETQAHIFEPFFTTKQEGIGTGLGLSTVYGIVKQNHGFIRVTSNPGEGARFDIYLPRHQSATQPGKTSISLAAAEQPGSETILLVEDEPALLALIQALIKKMGYTVLTASGSEEAIKVSTAYVGNIHLLMTDVVMPEMSGHELWQRLIRQRPGLRSLYISGYTADIIAHHGVIESNIHFLQKPFSRESLAAKLREVLSHSTTKNGNCL